MDKLRILEDNKGKSVIYMWTNLLNNKRYIGSSVDLNRRFKEYYNVNRLFNEDSMAISKALLKYGYCNFSLTVLEYCDCNDLLSREKYYFDLLLSEYNPPPLREASPYLPPTCFAKSFTLWILHGGGERITGSFI